MNDLQRPFHPARQTTYLMHMQGIELAAPGTLSIPTPSLTSGAGGIGGFYSDEDWARAIRHGVGQDGRALFILMLSNTFHYLSDEDLGALIAYLKSVPPVDNELPERRIEPLGRMMMATGIFPPPPAEQIDHTGPHPAAPEPGVTVAYGHYLSRTCTECHGPNLNGAPFSLPGQEVLTPNLTPGGPLAAWSDQDFFTTMHTGLASGGRHLDEQMPWKFYGQMTDEELRAVWLYLQSLPAMEQAE